MEQAKLFERNAVKDPPRMPRLSELKTEIRVPDVRHSAATKSISDIADEVREDVRCAICLERHSTEGCYDANISPRDWLKAYPWRNRKGTPQAVKSRLQVYAGMVEARQLVDILFLAGEFDRRAFEKAMDRIHPSRMGVIRARLCGWLHTSTMLEMRVRQNRDELPEWLVEALG